MAAPEKIKPLVLLQGEMVEGSFLYMVEQGVIEFEKATSIPVIKKHLKRDDDIYRSEERR